jgi:hypothetical protein
MCYAICMDMKAPILLREWLTNEDRSASWLGRQVGVAPSTVKRWLDGCGTIPMRETRRRLAEVTRLDVASEDSWI